MIHVDFQNLFSIDSSQRIKEEEWKDQEKHLPEYLKNIQQNAPGFLEILNDETAIKIREEFKKQREGKFDDIVLLGIGGSALGAKTLRDAFGTKTTPRLHIADNIDPQTTKELTDSIKLKKTLFLVVTKSGATPETLALYFFFRKCIEEKKLAPEDHFVFVTGGKGYLRTKAIEDNIKAFEIPGNIGGRFSVLSHTGLLPAELININTQKILKGAQNMREEFLSEKFSKNLPFQFASALFLLHKKGIQQQILMPYSDQLSSFTQWWAQLLAESTGKITKNGKNVGFTPIPSRGTTDQHSQLQLWMQGPNDKNIIFIRTEKFPQDQKIPVPKSDEELSFLNTSFGTLLNAEQKATAVSLTENNRPNIILTLPEISEETLGELLFFFEGVTAFLGEFLNIDAFNQPGVEKSKTLTQEYLNQ